MGIIFAERIFLMAFPQAWMHELMSRNDIVSVISEYTKLTSKGGRMWGLCPFHQERDPSFSVTPDKQLFHCFSCKAGGTVIQFIMQAENLNYIEAIRFLAQRAGMDMPNEVDDAKLRADKLKRDRLYSANREAALFYVKQLFSANGVAARQYLIQRGIDKNTAVKFGLGYAPNDWDVLFNHLSKLGYTRDELIDAGLCVHGRKNDDATFDFFHDRLMFPVISPAGKVLAFGGRLISGSDGAKYMNTGDTFIYNKRHNVYGINLMKGKKLSELIMVEGYMDVISLHQHGIDNAVASLGTALTSQQAKLISRYAQSVFYAYDGDSAGQKAMMRGLEIFEQTDVEPRVIRIPEDKDPDEFIRSYGKDAFLTLRDSAMSASEFRLEFMVGNYNLETVDGREKYAKEACEYISSLQPVERNRYLKLVFERTGIDIDTLKMQCGEVKTDTEYEQKKNTVGVFRRRKSISERVKAEQLLAASLLKSKEAAEEIRTISGFSTNLFKETHLGGFIQNLFDQYKITDSPDIATLIASCEGSEGEFAGGAADMVEQIDESFRTATDCIASITKYAIDEHIKELTELIELQSDPEIIRKYQAEQSELILKSRSIR